MEPIVDKAGQNALFALFLVFKVLAGLWIYQNIFQLIINLPFCCLVTSYGSHLVGLLYSI